MPDDADTPPAGNDGAGQGRPYWVQKLLVPITVSVVGAIAVTALTPLGETLRELLFPTKAVVSGSVLLDGEAVGDAELVLDKGDKLPVESNGGFQLEDVGDGNHRLHVTAPGAEATLRFNVARGATSQKVGAIQLTRLVELGYYLKTLRPPALSPDLPFDQAELPYEFTLWIDDRADVLRRIKSVSYTLPGPLPEPVIRSNHGQAFCYHLVGGLLVGELPATGAFERAFARVHLRGGEVIRLDAPLSNEPPDLDCPVTRKKSSTAGSGSGGGGGSRETGRGETGGGGSSSGGGGGGDQGGGSQNAGPMVPLVKGETYETASARLQARGFKVTRKDVDSEEPAGTVVAQDPKGGVSRPKGSTVELSVSRGPSAATVPDVRDVDQKTAEATLKQLGFEPDVQQQDVSDATLDGVVVDQKPSPGTEAKPGTQVTIYVGRFSG